MRSVRVPERSEGESSRPHQIIITTNMALSEYHQRYAALSVVEIAKRAGVKDEELGVVFSNLPPAKASETAKVAVLGCGNKRLVAHHRMIFEKYLRRKVDLTTYDITIDHLAGTPGAIRHDCTLPLPDTGFDITYGHVLLKFIPTEKQWDLIRNSVDALRPGGLAIHVLDKIDYETTSPTLPDGMFSVPLTRWKTRLAEAGHEILELPVKYGLVLVIKRGN